MAHDPTDPEVILASASPRRHELLHEAGVAFEIVPADVDETIDRALPAGAAAEDLAARKARTIAERGVERPSLPQSPSSPSNPAPRLPVLGADTLVVLGADGDASRRFLEKAADADEAAAMLRALSGTRHRVITGVAVWDPVSERVRSDHETTWVTMRLITEEEIRRYVESGEWRGKAGAYAIQETADRFVERLEGGGFDNVVGLPVERTLRLLRPPAADEQPG